ncbi:MAG: hypothetical protein V7K53_05415 [Nostoc sp.]
MSIPYTLISIESADIVQSLYVRHYSDFGAVGRNAKVIDNTLMG